MPETLHLRGYAPIPVGHRVELTCFAQPRLLSGSTPEWAEPMIRDLDTGIVYQHPWHTTGSYVLEPLRHQYPLDPHPQLQVVTKITARVVACRVISTVLH